MPVPAQAGTGIGFRLHGIEPHSPKADPGDIIASIYQPSDFHHSGPVGESIARLPEPGRQIAALSANLSPRITLNFLKS
jgi:hypothetical protein